MDRFVTKIKKRSLHYWRRYTSKINPEAIFIYGNQKSGTSAISALLGLATGKSYINDVFCRLSNIEEKLYNGETTVAELLSLGRYYFSFELIKDPSFLFFHEELKLFFPKAKYVFVIRDPRENIRSVLNRLDIEGHKRALDDYDWHRLDQQYPLWRPVLDGQLSKIGGENHIETLCLRWKKACEVFLRYKNNMNLIRYEDFCEDKVSSISGISKKLDLAVFHDIAPNINIQFQPKGRPGICLNEFFGNKNIDIIGSICGEYMDYFNYGMNV